MFSSCCSLVYTSHLSPQFGDDPGVEEEVFLDPGVEEEVFLVTQEWQQGRKL